MRRTLVALCAALMILLGIGASSAGAFSNGYLPESALAPIASGVKCERPLGQLSNQSAADFNSMALAAGRKLPTNGCDSAYRPYARQVYWRNYWCGRGLCGNAATPGYSNHGWGTATDDPPLTIGVIQRIGHNFCWAKTEAFQETWHYNDTGNCHRPDPGPNLHSPRLRRGSGGPGQGVYVRKLQKLLRGHGAKTLTVDGDFGRTTAIAVRRFQKAQKLPVNGVVSPRVWKRLRQPVSKPLPTTPKHVPLPGGKPAPPAHPNHPGPEKPGHHKPKPPKHHHPHKPKPKGPAWGIDLSSNNGCAIDFRKVRGDGASFVYTKATEGTTYVNPCFGRAQVRAIGAAHLVPGTYHWLSPGGASGAAEAGFYANAIGRAGYGKGFLMPAVDIEEATSLPDSAYCHEIGEFVHTLKKILGEKPIVYSYPAYVQEHLAGCSFLSHYLLWIAHLGVRHPTVPSPPWASTWALWQYSWTAHVDGVPHEVDVSKVFGGRRALVKLRVRDLPRRVRKPPRATKVKPPLAGVSSAQLRAAAPPAVEADVDEVAAPEGELESVTALPDGEVSAGPPSLEQALAELIHALAAAIGGRR